MTLSVPSPDSPLTVQSWQFCLFDIGLHTLLRSADYVWSLAKQLRDGQSGSVI